MGVACYQDGSDISFEIGTNSLPNHCYRANPDSPAGTTNFLAMEFYFFDHVLFNTKPRDMEAAEDVSSADSFYFTVIDDQAEMDNIRCQADWADS